MIRRLSFLGVPPPSGPPATEPIGLHLARTAKAMNRALDDALAEAGGSLPVWLILVSLKGRHHGTRAPSWPVSSVSRVRR